MYNKTVSNYPSAMQFVPEFYKTQEMCDKAVNTCFLVFYSGPDRYKTQEMCDRVVSKDAFMLIYCTDRYKTQKMCDEVVYDCLAALKFIPDWFVTSKMLEKFHDALLADDGILFYDEDFSKVKFLLLKCVFLV